MPEYHLPVKEIGKLGGLLALALGSQQIFEAILPADSAATVVSSVAVSVGMGTALCKSFFGIVGNILGSKVENAFDSFHSSISQFVNHDLQGSVLNSYERSFRKIEKEFMETYNLKLSAVERFGEMIVAEPSHRADLEKQARLFFTNVISFFTDEDGIKNLLTENGQLPLSSYFDHAVERVAVAWSIAEFSEADFKAFVKSRLPAYFNDYFLAELKNNDKTKTAYFKHLLELSLVHAVKIEKRVELLQQVATRTNNSVLGISADLRGFHSGQQKITERLMTIELLLNRRLQGIEGQLQWIRAFLESGQQESTIRVIRETTAQEVLVKWIPLLSLNTITVHDRGYNFNYKSRSTSFVGRAQAMNELYDFLGDERQFCWWMLTGTGGLGKSRLAMELCIQARSEGMSAGFYNDLSVTDKQWAEFRAPFETLIVVDYALANQDRTEKLIKDLFYLQNENLLLKKVRLLLIERSVDEQWKETQKGIELNNSCFRQALSPLDLGHDADDIRWEIIMEVVAGIGLGDILSAKKTEILQKLQQIDPHKTPLFAYFAGELINQTGDAVNWSAADLLSSLLNRLESDVWRKYPGFLADPLAFKKMFLFHTLTRKLSKENIIEFAIKHFAMRPVQALSYVSMLEDRDGNGDIYGLQPDILGEYFIIAQHSFFKKNGLEKAFTEVYHRAWQYDADQTLQTTQLLYRDFFVSAEIRDEGLLAFKNLLLNEQLYESLPLYQKGRAATLFERVAFMMLDVELATPSKCLEVLLNWHAHMEENKELSMATGVAVLNVKRKISDDLVGMAADNLKFITGLWKRYPDDRNFAYLVIIALNANLEYNGEQGLEKAKDSWFPLWKLIVEAFPNDQALVLAASYFLMNAMAYAVTEEWSELKIALVDTQLALLDRVPGNVNIYQSFLMFCINFLNHPVEDVVKYERLIARLYQKINYIRLNYDQYNAVDIGTSHCYQMLLYNFCEKGYNIPVNYEQCLNELAEIFNNSNKHDEVCYNTVNALASVIYYHKTKNLLSFSEILFQNLLQIFDDNRLENIAELAAVSIVNIVEEYMEAPEFPQKEQDYYLHTIFALHMEFESNEIILQRISSVLASLIFYHRNEPDSYLEKILDWFNFQLRCFEMHTNNAVIAEKLIVSINNVVCKIDVNVAFKNRDAILITLNHLLETHPANHYVQEQCSWIVRNWFVRTGLFGQTPVDGLLAYFRLFDFFIRKDRINLVIAENFIRAILSLAESDQIGYAVLFPLYEEHRDTIHDIGAKFPDSDNIKLNIFNLLEWLLYKQVDHQKLTQEETYDYLNVATQSYTASPDNEEFAEHYLFACFFVAKLFANSSQRVEKNKG